MQYLVSDENRASRSFGVGDITHLVLPKMLWIYGLS